MMVRSTSQIVLFLLWFLCGAKFSLSLSRSIPPTRCNRGDREVLLQFKKGVVDPSSLLSSWSDKEDCCEWIGIQCHNITGRVLELNLNFDFISMHNYSSKCLTGEINLCVLQLDFLNYLDLSENNFTAINDSLAFLDLGGNEVDGISDTLLNLQNLEHLDLSGNKLNGTIPKWLGQFKNLQVLGLSYNSFHGSIPLELGNLSSLTDLDISNNHLSGSLPETLHKLTSLSSLNIAGNSLRGVISESNFANLTSLTELDLSSSVFQFNVSSNWIPPFQLVEIDLDLCILGPKFPTWLYTQRSLQILSIPSTGISFVDHDKFWSFVSSHVTSILDISNNSISGDISNWTLSTTFIYLTSNKFNGGLPRITSLVLMFYAGNNLFSGSIAPFLCGIDDSNQHNLGDLDLSNNHLSGELPDCWMKWKCLTSINLEGNNLTGRIPSSMGSLSHLSALDLYDNNFSGDIPLPFQQCYELKFLILGKNQFSGSISSWIPLNIIALVLRGNKFSGNIPPNICQLSSLILLDLAENNLSGFIPQCLYHLTSMKNGSEVSIEMAMPKVFSAFPYMFWFHMKGQEFEYKFKFKTLWRLLDLSKNNLVGPIPHELFHLVGLASLNLSQNHLTGKIPPEISQMKILQSLDLSMNQLSGEIPQAMSSLSFLEYLNLSFNNFIGKIPTGTQLQGFDASCYMGNLELCGVPLKKCTEEKKSVDIVNAKAEDEFLSWFYIGMGVGFATGFWGVCVALFFKRSWRHVYFRFLDDIKDQLYVKVLLIMNSIR